MGTDVVGSSLKGVDIGSVEIRGLTSDSGVVPVELTANPGMSTGAGSYISVGGETAVGHYATAHLVDAAGNPADDLDLYIAGEEADPVPNLLHRPADQINDDVQLYEVYFYYKWSGQWASLCPYHDATGGATAMAIAEDPANPNKFIFACTATGVAAKCARIWGFRPWRTDTTWFYDDPSSSWVEKEFPLKPFYDVCKIAARAGYCQDRQSFTKNGTLVDLFDTRQFIWPNTIQNPWNPAVPDSQWMLAQEYFVSFDPLASDPTLHATALQRTRYRELAPENACDSFASIDRLERDHFEDGRWANPLTNTPRVEIFSGNYCTHDESQTGEALPWDCSPCTTAVCREMPQCCSADPTLPQPVWNAACVDKRQHVCQDVVDGGGPLWQPGRVWPRDVTGPAPAPQKYLIGPGGAVDRVDGVSTSGTSATVTGWACDPEWPGAAVAVAIYTGPREHGGTLVGTTYADLALAAPLAGEVATACDGAGLTTARHGFSFTLPASTSGDVFVYALDTATADGPEAPPTLLRNGIVRVPTCAHGEHDVGDALDASCSACAASVCAKSGLGSCCTTAWTDACAAAAETCTPTGASAAADDRAFAQVLTGWIEAPATGTYTFAAGVEPSRVFVNGQKLVDWWDGPGPTSGTIDLVRGIKYDIRWDRFQATTPVDPTAPGLTWQTPGALSPSAIPSGALYRVGPGGGTGLLATYYPGLAFAGTPMTRVDPGIDLSATTTLPSGIATPNYSTKWDGEIVPTYSETYTFTVTAAGDAALTVGSTSLLPPVAVGAPLAPACPHDICALGPKLAASTGIIHACDSCVDAICAQDPFCCDGGYLSYYSTEPEWDAKCIAEVKTICHETCTTPVPIPTTQQRKSVTIALQAGVHYPIHVEIQNSTSDRTAQLLWASASQLRQVVPWSALYPPATPANAGAGLNVVSFATKSNGTKPDLDTPLAAGPTADLSLAPAVGANGLAVVDVLAAPDDGTRATPPPPAIVSPRNGSTVYGVAPQVAVSGIGGVVGGSVQVLVDGAPGSVLSIASDGTFSGTVPVSGYGNHTLSFTQRTFASDPCVAPPAPFCGVSASIDWPVVVTAAAPATPDAPVITSPRDPTASPNPADDTFAVTGTAAPGVVNVCDLGGGATLTPTVTADGTGKINDVITLSAGSASDPNKGWHKLVFSKAACGSPGGSAPVFVSVGIRPPTVTFPRSGAEPSCTPAGNDGQFVHVTGSLPYAQAVLGPLRIYEETGHVGLRVVSRDLGVNDTPEPDGTFSFQGGVSLPPGKHLVYFFQAPDPPAGSTPDQIDAHFRAFASLANTPTSRLEIDVRPPSLPLPPIAPNGVITQVGPIKFGAAGCASVVAAPPPSCAQPFADVVVRDGQRTFTARADANGDWSMTLDVPPGWHPLRISQVLDSRAGGGWSESCESDPTLVGVTQGDPSKAPTVHTPGSITVDATSPDGAPVTYDASATTIDDKPAALSCRLPSGATFPIGQSTVLCEAIDPGTGAVGLGLFGVDVVDGPPVVTVPGPIVAEATSALGAVVSYEASAVDVVTGPLPVECAPASPALFALDTTTEVVCAATDAAGQTTSASFPVTVRDTTPPTLCPLTNVHVLASSPGGSVVSFATCASDVVDGADPVTCDHPSGSFFAVGTTLVTCTSTDHHGNTTAPATFVVSVADNRPPVLSLPATIVVPATSRLGARVTYHVTATDDTDPHPSVSCAPASGAQFPLGDTKVNCAATDATGNRSTGSFLVRVLVSFGHFLQPIDEDGSSVFYRPLPLLVRFTLAGGCAGIADFPAKLFLAPVDAAGHVGAEQPAHALPPFLGDNFVFIPLLRTYDLLLDTHALARGAYQLRVDLGDGATHTVRVTFR
ncbi:MAG TPA: PA14 domain-containing protein [Polyangia bacterium]|nr:PA14 domain-containing protein [Polyangia bacterium]